MKLGIVTFQKWHGRGIGSIGSSVIRGDWLVEKWPELEPWTNGKKFDAIILQKVYNEYFIRDFPGTKILDLCDPDWMDGNLNLRKVGMMVDAITCSTENIANFVKTVLPEKPVITIPDRLNLDHFTRRKKHYDQAKNVVWFGYRGNAEKALPTALPTLFRFKLNLTVVSEKKPDINLNYGINVKWVKWTPETAYENIQNADLSINPPLFASAKAKYKSNNKTLIAWALGLPVAHDDVELKRFMNPEERQKEVEMRRKEISENWDIMQSIKQFKSLLS